MIEQVAVTGILNNMDVKDKNRINQHFIADIMFEIGSLRAHIAKRSEVNLVQRNFFVHDYIRDILKMKFRIFQNKNVI